MKLTFKTLVIGAWCLWNGQVQAQQEPVATFFQSNQMHTNPAMTGAVYKHAANVLWRDYWTNQGPDNLPYQTTLWANYAMKLDKINSGVGVSYCYDAVAYQKRNTALLSYAYHLPIRSMYLSFGISGGVKTLNADYTGLIFETPVTEPRYQPTFSSDFGIALRHEKWNVGISVTQWNSPKMRSEDHTYSYQLVPHYRLFADYRFRLGENWSLTPQTQLLLNRTDLLTNLQVLATWKKQLWFGAGMQNFSLNANVFVISPMIGYDIKSTFRIGYAANISTSPYIYKSNHVLHEVVLSFLLK